MSLKRQIKGKAMNLNAFFSQHAVFTLEELDRFLAGKGSCNRHTRNSLLSYYRQQGRIIPIRRGLYAVVPPGMSLDTCPVDQYLLAAKMTSDAVLAYHTALAFYGNAYSTYDRFYFLSGRKSAPVTFRSYEFRCILTPRILRAKAKEMFGVNRFERSGVDVMVTSLERTFVDVLNRPDLSLSWEEIWRSLESVEYFDLDKVVEYALLLENATTAAKVGFFLEQHRESLMVEDEHLNPLRVLRPRQPHYLERGKRTAGRLVTDWNLVLPEAVLHRSWGEVL
jgi:predicted transcriptional regulator of viral defense system